MEQNNYKSLKIFLNIFGVISLGLFGTLLLLSAINSPLLLHGGALRFLRWEEGPMGVEMMLELVYLVWGIFFFIAAQKPTQYVSFLTFTIWTNLAHGLLMLIMSLMMPEFLYKIFLDTAYCLVLAAGLQILKPKGDEQPTSSLPM